MRNRFKPFLALLYQIKSQALRPRFDLRELRGIHRFWRFRGFTLQHCRDRSGIFTDFLFDFIGDFWVVLEELLGVFTTLADAL